MGYEKKTEWRIENDILNGGMNSIDSFKVGCRRMLEQLGYKKGRWLLVFDNADEIESGTDFRLGWIPRKGCGHLLITTRLSGDHERINDFQNALDGLEILKLDKLNTDAAALLLRAISSRFREISISTDEEYAARCIVGANCLDGHPLAIVQAGRYISKCRTSFAKYLEDIRTIEVTEMLSHVSAADGANILKTWVMSKQNLSAAARELLSILRWLSPDSIPERVVLDASEPSINAFEHSELLKFFGTSNEGSG